MVNDLLQVASHALNRRRFGPRSGVGAGDAMAACIPGVNGEAVGQCGDEAPPGAMVRCPFVQQDKRTTTSSSPQMDRLAIVGLDNASLSRHGFVRHAAS